MSGYMSRLFPRSNSSFLLRSGNALHAKVVRLRDETYIIDAGLGPPRICTGNELTGAPKSPEKTSFSNRVGFLNPSSGNSEVKMQMLERCFIDLVTGDPRTKERAAVRFSEAMGQDDSVEGEEKLLLPRKFRKYRAWMEMKKIHQKNGRVKGFVAEKVKGGYSVGIAGYLAFLPNRPYFVGQNSGDRYYIESINPNNIVVVRA
ncbi:small ribosomal subunit protein bS1m-like [Primulina tabacum]|uniref:small ribosomal subunit protein bS1m-like n=1 Tax=Primulina tabacum TaxID=48773 RepID=UPI003F5A7E91